MSLRATRCPQRVTGATAERGRGVYAWGHDGKYGRKAGNSLPSLTVLRYTQLAGDDKPKYIVYIKFVSFPFVGI